MMLQIVTKGRKFDIGSIVAPRAGIIGLPTDFRTGGRLRLVMDKIMTKGLDRRLRFSAQFLATDGAIHHLVVAAAFGATAFSFVLPHGLAGGVAQGGNLDIGRVVAPRAGVICLPAGLCAGRRLGIVVNQIVLQGVDGLRFPAQLRMADGAIDHLVEAACLGAGGFDYIFLYRLARGMSQGVDGLRFPAQLRMADGAIDHLVEATCPGAGGLYSVFLHRRPGHMIHGDGKGGSYAFERYRQGFCARRRIVEAGDHIRRQLVFLIYPVAVVGKKHAVGHVRRSRGRRFSINKFGRQGLHFRRTCRQTMPRGSQQIIVAIGGNDDRVLLPRCTWIIHIGEFRAAGKGIAADAGQALREVYPGNESGHISPGNGALTEIIHRPAAFDGQGAGGLVEGPIQISAAGAGGRRSRKPAEGELLRFALFGGEGRRGQQCQRQQERQQCDERPLP